MQVITYSSIFNGVELLDDLNITVILNYDQKSVIIQTLWLIVILDFKAELICRSICFDS